MGNNHISQPQKQILVKLQQQTIIQQNIHKNQIQVKKMKKVKQDRKLVEDDDYDDQKLMMQIPLKKVKQKQLNNLPYRDIVCIIFKDGLDNIGCGSGVRISKNLILTVAHNIYDKNYDRQMDKKTYKIYIHCGPAYLSQYYTVQDWRYLSNFKKQSKGNRITYDYALIKIRQYPKKQIQEQYLSISIPCQCILSKKSNLILQLYGYPYSKNNLQIASDDQDEEQSSKKMQLKLYGLSKQNCIYQIDFIKNKIFHTISSQPGISGSSIVYQNKIIGIHCGGGKEDKQFNLGVLVNKNMIDNLKKWSQQLHSFSFKINESQCQYCKLNKEQKQIQQIRKLQDIGNKLSKQGKYNDAHQIYQKILQRWQNIKGLQSKEVVLILQKITFNLQNNNQHIKAIQFYQKFLNIKQKIQVINFEFLQYYRHMGYLYETQTNFKLSLQYYSRSYEIEQKIKKQIKNLIRISENKLNKENNIEQALIGFKQALQLKQKINQKQNLQFATLLQNIGLSLICLSDYQKALEYYERSLKIYDKIQNISYKYLGKVFINMGLAYENIHQYEKGCDYLERSIHAFQSENGQGCLQAATSRYKLGMCHLLQSKVEEAAQQFQKSILIYRNFKVINEQYGSNLLSLGVLYQVKNHNSEAIKLLQEAIGIFEKQNKQNSLKLCATYLAKAWKGSNQFQKMENILQAYGIDKSEI